MAAAAADASDPPIDDKESSQADFGRLTKLALIRMTERLMQQEQQKPQKSKKRQWLTYQADDDTDEEKEDDDQPMLLNHAKIMLNASLKHKVGAPSFLSSGEMFGHLALFSPKTVHCHVEVTEVCGSKPWLN